MKAVQFSNPPTWSVSSTSAIAIAALLMMTCFLIAPVKAGLIDYRNVVLADNPVVYYELDESGGTTAGNSATTGATYTGTASGAVTVGQSSFTQGGTAYDFGGGVVQSASALTSSLTAWTMEAWVNWDSTKSSQSNFVSNDQGGWNDDVIFGVGPETGGVGVPGGSVGVIHQDNANQTRNSVGAPLAPNIWHHVVITGENGTGAGTSTLQLYVNGALVDSDSTVPGNVTFNGTGGFGAAPNLTLGASRPDGLRPYDGLLDEVAIYSSVLTPSQISQHFSVGTTPPSLIIIPEPSSAMLLAFSLSGLVIARRRKRSLAN